MYVLYVYTSRTRPGAAPKETRLLFVLAHVSFVRSRDDNPRPSSSRPRTKASTRHHVSISGASNEWGTDGSRESRIDLRRLAARLPRYYGDATTPGHDDTDYSPHALMYTGRQCNTNDTRRGSRSLSLSVPACLPACPPLVASSSCLLHCPSHSLARWGSDVRGAAILLPAAAAAAAARTFLRTECHVSRVCADLRSRGLS